MNRLGAYLLASVFIATPALARAQSSTGSIEGIVVDSSGAVLPGATVAVRQPAAAVERATITDSRGTFRLPLLPIGNYQLTATLPGFSTRLIDIRLTVGQTADIRVELAVAAPGQVVNVGADAVAITNSRSQVAAIVEEAAVHNLPVNGRNFLEFVLLTPGVTRDVRQGDLSFAGQRGTLNSVVVDGADNNNTFFGQALGRTGSGRSPYQFSQDAVQEFEVSSNSYSAEYGRAGGGLINVVTKSGTNVVHGSIFEFYRDVAMNATSVINELNGQPKSPYHYHQFGGTLGGPLRRNRDFYFLNYDGQRNRQSNLVFLNLPPNTPTDAQTAAGIARLQPLAASWDRSLNQDVFLIKTDHQVRSAQRLALRYNHQNFSGGNYENGGPQTALEHTGASLVQTRSLSAVWTSVMGSRLYNELRIHAAQDDEPGKANSDNPEAVVQQGGNLVMLIGRNNFSPRATTINRLQIADGLTMHRAAHLLKAGFDIQVDRIRNYFPAFFSGQYIFRSLASFAGGRPDGQNESYLQNFPGPGTSGAESRPNLSEFSLFLQDDWRLRPDFMVNLGLRYDLARLAAPPATNPDPQLLAAGIDTGRFDPDVNNLAPRLGAAWSPSGQNYVVRGGAGVYYGRIPAVLAAATSNNGINVSSVSFTGSAVPTYPQKFSSLPSGGTPARPNIFYIDHNFASSRVAQANAAIEWNLGQDTSFAATYLFAAGTSLARSIDRNLGSITERALRNAATGETLRYHFFGADRPYQSFQRVIAFESNAESSYHGITLDLNRRFTGGTMFRIAYTLGGVIDTVPDATAVAAGNVQDDAKYASNPSDFEADRTYGNNDQRQRLVASGVYRSGGWWFSGIMTAQSAQPYSARVNGDLNGDGNARNDLAPGTLRNALRGPGTLQLDLRIARDIPVGGRVRAQLIGEAFNLLNRDNIIGVNPVQFSLSDTTLMPNPGFGRPTATAGERIVQLAARIAF